MRARWFYGWNVVAAVFVMAMVSFGLGFYSLTVYLATLQRLHGWSAVTVSMPVTVYYLAGALVTMAIGDVYARLGPRGGVALGGLALAAAVAVLRRGPEDVGSGPDGDSPSAAPPRPAALEPGWRREALRSWRFWSVSAPFALGLAAQVGVLTHLVALVTPTLGIGDAARAVSTATAMAMLGRLATGLVVDRVSRRLVAGGAPAPPIPRGPVLAPAPSPATIYPRRAPFRAGGGD